MNWNLLNPNWLLSCLLEKMGVKTYLERTELAAHFFAGTTVWLSSVLICPYIAVAWLIWTLIDEFLIDGYKGREYGYDTFIDLASKLTVPVGYLIWLGLTLLV